MGDRTLIIGYDLGDVKTQMAVYNQELLEPVLLGQTEDNPDGWMNTEISLNDGQVLTDFMGKIRRGEVIEVDGRQSRPVNVLSYYFRKTLSLTRPLYPGQLIRQLVVTIADATQELVEIVYQALEKIGIGRDRALVLGHKQSFLYYVLYQKKEIWINDVGLFDYSQGRLRYYQMQVDRRKKPILVGVTEKDYSDALGQMNLEQVPRTAVFENVVYGAIHKQLLSSLYMTGEGFLGNWADEILQKLCNGRRLFKGQNLYVSGACYAAREYAGNPRLEDYLLLDQDMITGHVYMKAYSDADVQNIVLAKAGTPWYLVDEEVDVIPDGDSELALVAENIFNHTEKQFFIDFEPVLMRRERKCRVGVRIRFSNPHSCIVTLRDKGFGEIFPTSHRTWETTLDIS